jgi:hypothetical protein
LQRMLRLLMADREVREAAGKAAKQRIQEQYLWPKIVQEVEQAYLETIGWPSAAPVLVSIPDGVVSGAAPRGPQDGLLVGAAVIPMPAPDRTRRAA